MIDRGDDAMPAAPITGKAAGERPALEILQRSGVAPAPHTAPDPT